MATNPPAQTPLQTLEASLAQLATAFLPVAPKTFPDRYSDVELTRAKAYLVFAHAELEDYLETVCRAKAQRALDAVCSGQIDLTAISLVSYFGDRIGMVTELSKFKDKHTALVRDFAQPGLHVTRTLMATVKEALSGYTEQCRKNNGVKESNLLPLLLPLGFSPLTIDPAWLAEITGFGVNRGEHAHKGLSAVQQIADPFAALEHMRRIVEGPPGSAPPAGSNINIFSLRSLDALIWV